MIGQEDYPTWMVANWIYSEDEEKSFWVEAANEIYTKSSKDRVFSKEDAAVEELASEMLETYLENIPESVDGCYRDLMTYLLKEINWHEIADSFISKVCN